MDIHHISRPSVPYLFIHIYIVYLYLLFYSYHNISYSIYQFAFAGAAIQVCGWRPASQSFLCLKILGRRVSSFHPLCRGCQRGNLGLKQLVRSPFGSNQWCRNDANCAKCANGTGEQCLPCFAEGQYSSWRRLENV